MGTIVGNGLTQCHPSVHATGEEHCNNDDGEEDIEFQKFRNHRLPIAEKRYL